jgi:hypothetical protein
LLPSNFFFRSLFLERKIKNKESFVFQLVGIRGRERERYGSELTPHTHTFRGGKKARDVSLIQLQRRPPSLAKVHHNFVFLSSTTTRIVLEETRGGQVGSKL